MLEKFWKEIVGLLLLVALLAAGGFSMYKLGYDRATLKHDQQTLADQKLLDSRVQNLEGYSRALALQASAGQQSLKKDLDKLLARQPGVFTINGKECTLSSDFVETYNEMIRRANKK